MGEDGLKLLREAGTCSRADLVRTSGMSAPTVTNVIADLLSAELVQPLGEGASNGGRPPDLIRFKAERGCLVSVRITAQFVSFLLTDLCGKELDTSEVWLAGRKTTPEAMCALIAEEIRRILRARGLKRDQVRTGDHERGRRRGVGDQHAGELARRSTAIDVEAERRMPGDGGERHEPRGAG